MYVLLKMSIKQTESIIMYLLILPSLAFDIMRYHSLIAVSSNGVDIVSAYPNMPRPNVFS